ncbi:MAG: energy-coupling factor transporter ATPase [Candidatus Zhuqueibacterota bacterium]
MTIKFENISYAYDGNLPQKRHVLKNIDLEIRDGEFVGIIGPTGSGKTTLLQHFTGLLQPASGKIFVNGEDIWSKKYPLNELRKKIGLVFQFPESQLFEETVAEDVAFGPKSLGLSEQEIEQRVQQALEMVGLVGEEINNRSPHQLSEGEKRRVAIAGVLAMAPEVLILDEPTACLDPSGIKSIMKILRHLHKDGTTIVMITHNMDVITQLAERIIILNLGMKYFDGAISEIYTDEHIFNDIDLEIPRIVRLSRYLAAQGLIDTKNIGTLDELKGKIKQLQSLTDVCSG